MKESFYFRHDYNARNDTGILELRAEFGYEGYGVYWALVETLAESSDGYLNGEAIGGLSVGLGVAKDRLQSIIGLCVRVGLLKRDVDGNLFSDRMLEHKKERARYSAGGKKGASRRWKRPDRGATAPPTGTPNAKERRGEEKKEEKPKEENRKPDAPPLSVEEAAREFKRVAVQQGWCDEPYADKTVAQVGQLGRDDRAEFARKVRVMANSATHPRTLGFARKVYGEIAGLVNDRGAMQRVLTAKEQAERRDFAREESGEAYVREELGS